MNKQLDKINKILRQVISGLEYTPKDFLTVMKKFNRTKNLVEHMDIRMDILKAIQIIKPHPQSMLWWECSNCFNKALIPREIKTPDDECNCGSIKWKLMKRQRAWCPGANDWSYSKGEV